jgi:hypothetical protein
MRRGGDFEALVEQIISLLVAIDGVSTVERNVLMAGPDGPREIDILVRSKVGPFDITTVIECKDTARVVPVPAVDALESKMRDVKANKAALVARRGFSKGARRKADRCGVALLLANELHLVKDLPFEVSVHVQSFELTGLQLSGTVPLQAGASFDQRDLLTLDGRDLVAEARDYVLSLGPPEPGVQLQWTPEPPPSGWRMPTSHGGESIENLCVTFELTTRHLFGYLNDLTSVLYLRDELQAQHSFLIPAEALMNGMFESFVEFSSPDDLPCDPLVSLNILEIGDPRLDKIQFATRRLDD